jgi:hypothetical protein
MTTITETQNALYLTHPQYGRIQVTNTTDHHVFFITRRLRHDGTIYTGEICEDLDTFVTEIYGGGDDN